MGFLKSWLDGFKPAVNVAYGTEPSYADTDGISTYEKASVLGRDEFANTAVAVKTENNGVAFVPEKTALKRNLAGRHIQFIALGGSIGTGLFIGSGSAYAEGGPGSLMIAFLVIAVMLVTTVFALGELAAVLPVSGAFSTYSTRFVDPSWGVAMGWNYWLQWLVALPLELTAATIIIQFWDSEEVVPKGVWIAIGLLIIIAINLFGVRGYGEFEFIASLLKVIGCIGFIICAIVIDCGGTPGTPGSEGYLGARGWHVPGYGAFVNGFKGFCSIFITAAFAFSGTELVGLAAAETSNPRKQLPKAAKQVLFRVLIFYILSLFMITLIVPPNMQELNGSGDGNDPRASPFVIAIQIGGIKALPQIFNAVILISALSVANASVYGASRTLLALAEQGGAPPIFKYVDREGRPLPAVIVSLLFGLLGFLIYYASQSTVFDWLLAISGLSSIFAWASTCLAHIRFRKAWKLEGNPLSLLPWASPLGELGSWVGLSLNIIVVCAAFYEAAFPIGESEMNASDRANAFFQSMISLPIVLVFFLLHKLISRSRYVRLNEIDIHTGRRDPVSLEVLEEERAEERAKPLFWKIFDAIF
ncbi:hypothetical protein MVES1_002932 [Malassezia vespertilionis]|uniref:Amino acid permease/ SLC12A domain-containing protein n=1 Tax=Malassezia vespertilionis TaxID=2020962 RepID=A0A2N1J9X1_9BASI|nr:uncharacterized protein MVES1_002932 [Malassezia vespertilionis]PKI83347.1 hypothetical protein MVES_002781 [Malassezia vespertilionis]WFD07565.1 hypothetical protein MVES1_002932 [Malassezia vespertilionis]